LTFEREKMRTLSMILRTVLLLLLTQTAFSFIAVSAHAVRPCNFGDDAPRSRPNPEAGPTEIRAAIFIFDLVDINTRKEEFTLDFFVETRWKDERLGDMARKKGLSLCETPVGSIWTPGMILINSRETRTQLPVVFYVHADGTVEGENRYIGTFAAPFDLSDFPLDTQTLPLKFISRKYGPDELSIVFEGTGAGKVFSETAWDARLGKLKAGVFELNLLMDTDEEEPVKLALFEYEIEVKRRIMYYVWKVFLPLCVIVFASWAIFWIDPTHIGVQTGIGTAMLLTIIAFLFSLERSLPKIDYLSRMDIFVYSSLVFVFLAFVQGLCTCTIAAHGKEQLARRIDHWSRAIFPLAYAAAIAWFWMG
jgi:hypothetical protein